MYSSESIRIAANILNFAYKIKCVPFYMVNGRNSRLQMVSPPVELFKIKLVCACVILLQTITLALGLYYELCYNPKQSERAQFYFAAASLLIAMFFQFVTIIFSDQVFELVETYLIFGEVLRT